MQSLAENCQAVVPAISSLVRLSEHQQLPEASGGDVILAGISPITIAAGPQFGHSIACSEAPALDKLGCGEAASPIESPSRLRTKSVLQSDLSTNPALDPTVPVALQTGLGQVLAVVPVIQSPQFIPPTAQHAALRHSQERPASGAQFYRQRELALRAGRLYTRLAPDQFAEQWSRVTGQPTYQDWLRLLAQEARAVATGQGQNRLEIVLGDSLGLWLPSDQLPRDRLWLNQSISGDTTTGIVSRISAFADTRPTTIHLLAGVNDLKAGVPESRIVNSVRLTLQRLRQQHPQAQIVVYSVLPTRRTEIANDRVRSLNRQLALLTQQPAVEFQNMHPLFQDQWGDLRSDLTTDGLHLNRQGYALYRQAILASSR